MELISKQNVLDALRTCYDTETITMDNGDEYINYEDAVGEIEQLPSAHPEIIRCKDCKHYWIHKCMDSMAMEICDLEQTFYDAEIDFCSLAEREENG